MKFNFLLGVLRVLIAILVIVVVLYFLTKGSSK